MRRNLMLKKGIYVLVVLLLLLSTFGWNWFDNRTYAEDMPTTAQGIDVRGTVVTTGDQISITDAIDTASQCILSHAPTDDWSAFALARAGKSVPQAYIPQEEQRLTDAGGVFQDVTEYARMALAVQAAGGNPAALAGYDTIEKMYNHDRITNQGINDPIYTLFVLDAGNYTVLADAKWSKVKLIEWLIAQQNDDGSFALSKGQGAAVE